MHTGEPSMTARRVAAQRLTFSRLQTDYGDPAADERLARHVADGIDASGSPLRRYLEARTRFFDAVVVQSIGGGMRQIVVGAAGYDGRAWRYGNQDVAWFEVDHPATQRDKLERLAALEIGTERVCFVAADFAVDPLRPPLLAAGLEPDRPVLFLLEGVAVYLERTTLESVMRQFRDLAAPGSLLAISLSVSGASRQAEEGRKRFREAVAKMGEPALSTVEPEEVEGLLTGTGWRSRAVAAGEPESQSRLEAAGLVLAEPI